MGMLIGNEVISKKKFFNEFKEFCRLNNIGIKGLAHIDGKYHFDLEFPPDKLKLITDKLKEIEIKNKQSRWW